jgi:hypothetical protein
MLSVADTGSIGSAPEAEPTPTPQEPGTGKPVQNKGPRYIYDTIFNKMSQRIGLMCLIASFFLPTDGGGFTICWFDNLFDLPCPGCGLGRSITNMTHLDPGAAFDYHPWGIPLYFLIVVLAVSNFFPQRWLDAMRAWMVTRENRARWFYWTFIGTFLVYGFVRLGYFMTVAPA